MPPTRGDPVEVAYMTQMATAGPPATTGGRRPLQRQHRTAAAVRDTHKKKRPALTVNRARVSHQRRPAVD